MDVETRESALFLIRRDNVFLVAEIRDPQTATILHRPPGGGVEHDENPEQAVRRELKEELGITLTTVHALGTIDHIWFWNGHEVRERAWMFSASSSDDSRLSRGESPDLVEANGQRVRTLWRPFQSVAGTLPPLCPSALSDLLKSLP